MRARDERGPTSDRFTLPACDAGRDRLKGPVVTYKPRSLDTQVGDKRSVSWDRDDRTAARPAEGEDTVSRAKPPPFPKRPEYEEKARQRVSKVSRGMCEWAGGRVARLE